MRLGFIPEKGSNARTALFSASFALGMLGMSFAAVPLYRLFCQVTGFGGTTQRVEQVAERQLDRTIKVRFDAQAAGSLGWQFKPKVREVELKLGEATTMEYFAKNLGSLATTGEATFNVTPNNAGAYFNKLECFCFTETELASGDSMDMPVYFFIDPDLAENSDLDNLTTITLSYTFFPVDKAGDQVAKAELENEGAATGL
ncbi:MAG: cytochrome c oxidase assembly protein [Pseudomonadota bacterium]